MELKHVIEHIVAHKHDELAKSFAISDDVSSFTYEELINYAQIVAANLKRDGIIYGDRIIVESKRNKEYVGALLGCWIMGAVTVPLSDDYPEDRLAYIKSDSKCKLSIDDKYLEKLDKNIKEEPIVANLDDNGLVIYTSGSTGNPKGVVHSFRSMTAVAARNTIHDAAEDTKKNEIVGLIAPFTFVVGMSLTLAALSIGKHLVLAPDEIRKDPFKLAKYYDDNNIQSSFISPRMVDFMLAHNKSLKVISVGSERITNIYYNDNPVVMNGYGSTETFGGVLGFKIDKPYENTPIGQPFGKEKAYVLDDKNNEVEQGELCIAGDVANGYLNLEEESKKAFVKNPFFEKDGFPRMFRTRDIVKRLPDGNLVFIERKDWMIKINGQRVEPLEIETAIRRIKGIKSVAIKDFTSKNGVTYLAAYYVSDGSVNEKEIKEYCKANLTSYMVPTFYIKMDVLPVNPNGKLDRKNLPEPDLSAFKAEYVAPINKIEQSLCQEIENILNCGRVGRNDDFFLLGGDSIKSLDLINRLDDLPLDLETVFEGKTPAKIAYLIENGGKDEIEFDRVKKEAYPLTASQLGVYFPCVSNPTTLEYNNPIKISLNDSIDLNKLGVAITKAINNHAGYKCKIDLVDGNPCMIPCESTFKVNFVKSNDLTQEINNFIKPFNFPKGELVRATIVDGDNKVLLFDAHHLVFDGTSLSILLKEIKNGYEGKELYEEKTSMLDLSTYEEVVKTSNKYLEAEKYYSSIFDGLEIANDFPEDYDDEHNNTQGTIPLDFDLNQEQLNKFLKSNALTENSFFLAVYGYVLAKFNGSNKSLVCVGESGRHTSMTFNTCGMLVKTIALPIELDNYSDIAQYVASIQESFKSSVKNDCYPFTDLASKYGLANDFSFVYQGSEFTSLTLNNETFPVDGIKNPNALAKLTLMVFKRGTSYHLSFRYRSDLFAKEIIESFAQTFIQVSQEFIFKENFNDVILASADEIKRLDSFNDNKVPFYNKTVSELFTDCVNKYPNNLLVAYKDNKYTYAEGNKYANKVANYLLDKGIKRNDVVAIMIPKSEKCLLCAYGVLKAGAAYQPLDITYPSERLNFIVNDSNAKVLITTSELEPIITNFKGQILYLDQIDELTNEQNVLVKNDPDDLFVLLYTSGTTGTPKGVMLCHRNISCLVHYNHTHWPLDETSRMAAYASFGFDAGMQDLFTTSTIGGALYVIPDEIRLDLIAVDDFMIKNEITQAFMTTQVGRQYALNSKHKGMKYFTVGGEKLVPYDLKDVAFQIKNMYGPTETTAYVTNYPVDKIYKRIPIGPAIDNVSLYVVDKDLKRLPVGVPGELLITGPHVGKGYLNLSEKTKASFIDNPFSNEENYNKAYRTGDIVRYLANGHIDFIGRNDEQVKIRGFRIELTEVEQIIRKYKDIKDVAVTAFDDPNGGKYIAAYVVSDVKVDLADLRQFIASSKPAYMVPEAMTQIERIPLNQNSKVNKRALPVIQKSHFTKEKSSDHHEDNILVKRIRKILKEILNDDQFDYMDNLFDYGMNSLSIVRLSVLLNKEFGVNADVKELLTNCSIAAIENLLINDLLKDNNKQDEKHEIRSAYPLNKSQLGIYVEYLKDVDSIRYNIPIYFNFAKEKYPHLTSEKIVKALKEVINAHPSMKCTIESNSEGKAMMIPHYDREVIIKVDKISDVELKELKDNFVKPHQLNKAVYRLQVMETDQEIVVFLDVHHIMFDGSSQNIFIEDFKKALLEETLIKENYSIFDASIDEEKNSNSEAFSKAKDYYNNLLSIVDGATIIEKDNFEKQIIPQTYNLVSEDVNLDRLTRFVKENNVTLNAFFMSAYALLLSRMTYQNNVCFSTVYNGRNSVNMSKLIGMTVKTLPFALSFEGANKVQDLIKGSKEQLLASMNNDIYSFSDIAKDIGLTLEMLFVYQGAIGKNNGFDINFLALNDLKCDITFEVRNDDQKLYLHVEYNNGKYSENFISRLVSYFVNVCNEMLVKDDVNEISLLCDKDKVEIKQVNNNDIVIPQRSIIYPIIENMKKTPNKTAITYLNKKITYQQLDVLTNSIAHYIQSLGLGKEDVVSILTHRDENIVVLPVGVLRSNAAYEPIDASYPKERINFMIKDSGAKLLICNKDLRDLADQYNGNVLYIEDIVNLPIVDDVELKVNWNDLMIMIYTSGTTGLPKGIMLEHRNISSFVYYDAINREINNDSIVSSFASFGFDASLFETYPALVKGGSIVIVDENIRLDLPKLEELFINEKITVGFMTTQMARQFILFTKSPYLKSFSFGGEKIVPFYRDDVNFKFINCYGPTEGSIYCTSFVIDKLYERVPIGKSNNNVKSYILDKNNHLLPFGAIGELAIAGNQVARGYLNRPEKNASAFIKNEFDSDEIYQTIYKTGDICRMKEDGTIDIIGRNDGQVKIRGFRIEIPEVEEIINRYPGIKKAAVNAYDDPNGGKYLAAFIVSEEKINAKDVNNFIMQEKPPYMVPRVFVQIEEIPYTVNGKVDKKKLPEPDLSLVQDEYVVPVTELEKEFCDLFASILGINKISVTDDFFMLGGTSINAAQIVSYAFTKGYDLVYKNIFDNPSPRLLANFLSHENVEDKDTIPEPINEFKGYVEPTFANNVSEKLNDLEIHDIGDVLLFGATGFLGSHLLKELLDNSNRKVICVVRGNELQEPKDRLMTLLEYYFENPYEELFDKRLFVVSGDMLDDDIVSKVKGYQFDTIINSAALVKHFASDDSIEKTNTGGAINLVNLCLKLNKRLVHISTLSVSGESINDNIPIDFKFKENMLDIGQLVDNKYIKSKYDAEYQIKEAIASYGLKAKIIRVGNLMSRSNDGEFQINFNTNNFMNTIKAFKLLGYVPYDMLNHNVEFSQIDLVAKAILLLASTNDMFNVYHVNNVHTIQMNNVIRELNLNGIKIKPCSNEEFGLALNNLLSKKNDIRSLNSLLAYRANRNEKRRMVATSNTFTLDTLYRLGFYWPLPDSEYLSKLIKYLISVEFLK